MSNALYNWKRTKDDNLEDNFKANEFECHCNECEDQMVSVKLIDRLQLVRNDYGKSITITSGFRCDEHQKALQKVTKKKAAKVSQHVFGEAADIMVPDNKDDAFILLKLLQKHFNAVGIAKTFYHVDTRDDRKRTWFY